MPGLVRPSPELGSASDTGAASVPAARIIVVDDESSIADFAMQLLTASGHHVSAFTSPEEAVQEAARIHAPGNRVDLIITDLSMPERNGWWVLQTIKRLDPRIPVVLATGWNIERRDVELASRGLDDILAKPFARRSSARWFGGTSGPLGRTRPLLHPVEPAVAAPAVPYSATSEATCR
ncbi:MAG: hypothetical protein C4289_07195 [Chloroflexota bacterium]